MWISLPDILEPRAIVFTSIDAWEQYTCHNGEFANDKRKIYTTHPGRPWHSKQNKLNGQSGKEVFEARLRELYEYGHTIEKHDRYLE